MSKAPLPPIEVYRTREMMKLIRSGGAQFARTDGRFNEEGYTEQWDAPSCATYVSTVFGGRWHVYRLWGDETGGIAAEEDLGEVGGPMSASVLALRAEAYYLADIARMEDELVP